MHTVGVLERVGRTPVVRLRRLVPPDAAWVLVKDETANPTGHLHDRTALALVEAAVADGRLKPGGTLVAADGADFGLSLAFVAAARGFRSIVAMPESAGPSRREAVECWGAEVHLTPAAEGAAGAESRAARLADEKPDRVLLDPSHDPANPGYHRRETAAEIWRAASGRIDAFVCHIATGGTLGGVAALLKERLTHVEIVAAELETPADEERGLLGGRSTAREAGSPAAEAVADRRRVDLTVRVDRDEAGALRERLASLEGLYTGLVGAANVAAAIHVARRLGPGRVVFTLIPDHGARAAAVPA